MDKPTGAGEALAKKLERIAEYPSITRIGVHGSPLSGLLREAAALLTEQSRHRPEPIAQPVSDRPEPIRRKLAVLLDSLYGLHVRPGHVDAVLEALTTEQSRQQDALRELCDAAFDYHVHSELSPGVVGVEKTTRLLQARQDALDTLPAPSQPKEPRDDVSQTPDERTLLQKAVDDREARPWRYYRLDHDTMKKFCEQLADKLATSEARCRQLEQALKPFAAMVHEDGVEAPYPEDVWIPLLQAAKDALNG